MPSNVALNATELARLNSGNHKAPHYLSYHKDTVIATATVSATPSGFSTAKLSVSGTSVNWLNTRDGMACKITDSLGTTLRGYYRVRPSGAASTYLNIEEIAPADPGFLATSFRTGAIQSTDLISIIERYDLYAVKPHTLAGVINQDWDIAVGTHNTKPEPVLNIVINSRWRDYVTMIDSDQGVQAITAVASVIKWPTSAGSTVGYAWTVPAAFTSVSGAATATLTANVPPGDYILYCQMTDSVAGTFTGSAWVRVHSPGDPPLLVNVTSDGADMNSGKITVRAVKSIISAIPPGAKCAIWGPMTWGGLDVASARHGMVGYLYQQPFSHVPGFYETSADIYSSAAMLDQRMCSPATLKYAGTPVNWEELDPTLQTVQFAMWWVLRWRCANFLQSCNFTPLSTSSSTGRRINIPIGQGSILSQLKALADMCDANIGSRADGELISVKLPWMLADQTGLVYRGTFDNTMYSDVKVTWRRQIDTGYVRHEGFYSDLVSDTAVAADWPGLQTYGQGGKTEKKTGKIYESQEDNQERVGCAAAYANREYVQVDLDFNDNWDVLEPADCLPMIVNVPANKSPTGAAISIKCVPTGVQKTWTLGRRARLHVVAVGLTDGYAGQPVPPPPVVATPPQPVITIPPVVMPAVSDSGSTIIVPTPVPTGQVAKFTGEGLFAGSNTDAYVLRNFISLKTPQSTKVTPLDITGYAIQAVLVEPNPSSTHLGGYVPGYNASTDMSAAWYTPHLAAPAPDWTKGADVSGHYSVLRGTNVAGSIEMYGSGQVQTIFDFKIAAYSWIPSVGPNTDHGGYFIAPGFCTGTASAGWVTGHGFKGIQNFDSGCGCGSNVNSVDYIELPSSAGYAWHGVTSIDITVDSGSFPAGTTSIYAYYQDLSGTWHGTVITPAGAGITTSTWTFSDNVQALAVDLGACDTATDIYIQKVVVNSGAGNAQVALSTDYGATFAAPVTVGSGAPVLGFDISRNSATSYAACVAKVRKTTTLGGAYSDFVAFTGANPVCVVIPYFRRASNTTDETGLTNPDFVAALDQADSGGGTLYWCDGATGTKHDITPVAGMTFDNANCITTHYGTKIYAFGKVSGVYKLYYSNNTGTTWTQVGTRTAPTFIRGRRNNALLARPQIYLADNGSMYFTSYGYTGPSGTPFVRNMPDTIVSFDTLW